MSRVRPQQHRLQWPITREQWEGIDEMLGAIFRALRVTDAAANAASGVTAGEYGDSTHVPQITVDELGLITNAVEVAISAGTVTTTGSPANGNLAKFSGATSITNADLTGDVTTSGTVAATIANDAVTYAKMQNVSAASKLLGRGDGGGSGDVQEITLGSGLSMSGTTLSSSGGGSGALVLLDQQTASASSSLDLTAWYSSTYDEYLIELVNLVPATNAVNCLLRVSTDGGSSYDSGNNYQWAGFRASKAGSAAAGATATSSIGLDASGTVSNSSTAGGLCGSFRLFDPGSSSLHKRVKGEIGINDGTANPDITCMISGNYVSATAVNAFRVLMSSGNITSGTIRVYGVAKS